MSRIVFDDGKEVKLSKETEQRLRKELLIPSYKDSLLECRIVSGAVFFPISLTTNGTMGTITRDVKDVERYIKALQEAVEYCKQYNIGA